MALDGKRIRTRRNELGLTQAQLAEKTGIPQESISKLENGRLPGRDAETQDRLAAALSTTVDYLRGNPVTDVAVKVDDMGTLLRRFRDPLEAALSAAFNGKAHRISDAVAVILALEGTEQMLPQGEALRDAARRWLDVAAAMRSAGQPVTAQSLAIAITVGSSFTRTKGAR